MSGSCGKAQGGVAEVLASLGGCCRCALQGTQESLQGTQALAAWVVPEVQRVVPCSIAVVALYSARYRVRGRCRVRGHLGKLAALQGTQVIVYSG